ncbi:MAG: hypothetical protein ACYTBY_05610 [Planctomycetota bacterium]|jgi:hypothetical protein
MSFVSKGKALNCNSLVLGGIYADSTASINISHSDPNKKILVNGIEPSAGGGGASLPITGTGDINISGNITANDDGTNTKGVITSERGVSSTGDIQTTSATADIISANNFYFDGTDIFKRTINQGIPVDTAYYRFRNLAVKQEANEFTGENHFLDIQYFGLSDGQPTPTYTNNITLNNLSGNITSVGNVSSNSANIDTQITCGNITCDNGSTNTCKARLFNTRTSGTNGWDIKQELENNAPSDNILQIAATQQQVVGKPVELYITSSEYDPTQGHNPNIKLIPDTVLNGGQVQASQVIFGTGTNRFQFKQDIGGTLDQVLQINAKDASSEVRFRDNNSANIMVIKNDAIDLKNTSPINFGLYAFRPIQYTLTRNITIAAAPDITNFTNMAFNCRSDTWIRVNDGASTSLYNAALEGYYKCTITQTGVSSAGNFDFCDIMFDYVLHMSIQTAPDIDITEPAFNYRKKPTNQPRPTIEIDHLNTPVQSQPVFVLYPNQSAGETMPIQVRLTKMDY